MQLFERVFTSGQKYYVTSDIKFDEFDVTKYPRKMIFLASSKDYALDYGKNTNNQDYGYLYTVELTRDVKLFDYDDDEDVARLTKSFGGPDKPFPDPYMAGPWEPPTVKKVMRKLDDYMYAQNKYVLKNIKKLGYEGSTESTDGHGKASKNLILFVDDCIQILKRSKI
jgi:hypothetical protein